MTYYALKDSDWAFDDQDEGRAIVVQADTPEEAISKATAMHIQEYPGAGGVTWEVARLDLVGIGDAEWDDDNQPKFEAFRFYEEGLNDLYYSLWFSRYHSMKEYEEEILEEIKRREKDDRLR